MGIGIARTVLYDCNRIAKPDRLGVFFVRGTDMQLIRFLDTPYAWGVLGFAIGAALGVTALSVWLVAIGLGAYLVYVRLHGPPQRGTETSLFSAGPAFMMSWVLGFIVNGVAF